VALIGMVRVSAAKRETQRQHDALDPICERVFKEKDGGKLAVDERPGLKAARNRGHVGGQPRVIDDAKRAIILSRRAKGDSIRVIARVLDVSVGTVHGVIAEETSGATT